MEIIDVTGIKLTPGNEGKDCLGNGAHFDENGNRIECCCDECDYLKLCLSEEEKKMIGIKWKRDEQSPSHTINNKLSM